MTEQKQKVFLFNGYGKFGGSYMLYQIGRICYEEFNTSVYIVQTYKGKRGAGRFSYPYDFPTISIKKMFDIMSPNDVFFCNPAHSSNNFGSRLPGQKVMFLQGVTTFTNLDTNFDHYVSSSMFVQQYVKKKYHVDSQVINPFISVDIFNKGIPWKKRSNQILLLTYKKETFREYKRLLRLYQRKYSLGSLSFKKIQNLPQEQLSTMMGQHKYYLTLTPMEGFGLPPLEAMSSGCAVFGFDGYGGQDYFTTNNSCVTEYQHYKPLIEFLHKISRDPDAGLKFSQKATETAEKFTFDRYKKEWTHFLSNHVLTE